jgi:transcriptional regulator with XRE-family HTH domain
VLALVTRDWAGARRRKERWWAGRAGLQHDVDVLVAHVKSVLPNWPTERDREEDLEAHRQLSDKLARAPAVYCQYVSHMDEALPARLGANMKELRERRGLSQHQMAKLAGIPRPTWGNLESGTANPTLQVLTRVAAALQVRLEELLAPPRGTARLHRADTLTVRRRGAVTIRRLLPEPLPGLEIERMELPAGAAFAGIPHTEGTREYLTCESGLVELSTAGDRFTLSPGDVVVFRGDQKHGYRNPTRQLAIAYSVVAFSPIG